MELRVIGLVVIHYDQILPMFNYVKMIILIEYFLYFLFQGNGKINWNVYSQSIRSSFSMEEGSRVGLLSSMVK